MMTTRKIWFVYKDRPFIPGSGFDLHCVPVATISILAQVPVAMSTQTIIKHWGYTDYHLFCQVRLWMAGYKQAIFMRIILWSVGN